MHAVHARILDVIAASDVYRHRAVMRRDLLGNGGAVGGERIAQLKLRSDFLLDVLEIFQRDEVPIQDRRQPDFGTRARQNETTARRIFAASWRAMAGPEQKLADGRGAVGIRRHDLLDICGGRNLQRHAHWSS